MPFLNILIFIVLFCPNLCQYFILWVYHSPRTTEVHGRMTHWEFLKIRTEQKYQKIILITFIHLQKLYRFWKLWGCGSKDMPATPFSILNFKWVWQTQFLSHTSQILKNYVFFIDVQMILVSFFDIPYQKSAIWKKAIFIFNFRPSYAGNGPKPA